MPSNSGLFASIDHLGIAVRDMAEGLALYCDQLGMSAIHHEVNHEQGLSETMLRISPNDSGPMIQLLTPTQSDSSVARFLDRSGPGIHHVAYRVDDVEAAMAALLGEGMTMVYDSPRTGTWGSRINFVHPKSASDVLIEIVERQPMGHEGDDVG